MNKTIVGTVSILSGFVALDGDVKAIKSSGQHGTKRLTRQM